MAVRIIVINTTLNSIIQDNNALQVIIVARKTTHKVQAGSFHVDNCIRLLGAPRKYVLHVLGPGLD
jgi:hypothetical protein